MNLLTIDGVPILNAKHAMTITVTAADIAAADVKHPEGCAVARAAIRHGHATEARVHLARVYIKTTKDHWLRYVTPKSMRAEIIAFDRGGTFQPGSFELLAPNVARRADGKRQGSPAKNKPWHLRRMAPKRRSPSIIKNVRNGPA